LYCRILLATILLRKGNEDDAYLHQILSVENERTRALHDGLLLFITKYVNPDKQSEVFGKERLDVVKRRIGVVLDILT
jgi:hypothetical protein